MKFFYNPALSASPETGDPQLILRPMLPVRIIGPRRSGNFLALADTGADNTIFPKRVADDLGIQLDRGTGPQVTAFGGQKLSVLFRIVRIEVSDGTQTHCWQHRAQFFGLPSPDEETLVLGHSGFFDYFTATFDGLLGVLSLERDEEMPDLP